VLEFYRSLWAGGVSYSYCGREQVQLVGVLWAAARGSGGYVWCEVWMFAQAVARCPVSAEFGVDVVVLRRGVDRMAGWLGQGSCWELGALTCMSWGWGGGRL